MTRVKRCYAYNKMDKEDPEDIIHRRAQFLIYKALQQADARRRPCFLRIRICKLKIKIGKKLKKLRKSMLFNISVAKVGVHRQVMGRLNTWKKLFCSTKETMVVSLPDPIFT